MTHAKCVRVERSACLSALHVVPVKHLHIPREEQLHEIPTSDNLDRVGEFCSFVLYDESAGSQLSGPPLWTKDNTADSIGSRQDQTRI